MNSKKKFYQKNASTQIEKRIKDLKKELIDHQNNRPRPSLPAAISKPKAKRNRPYISNWKLNYKIKKNQW